MKPTIHLKAWKRDHHDSRDKILKVSSSDPLHKFPTKVDNSPFCPPVRDQGPLGSCTAHMFTSMVEYNDIRFGTVAGFTDVSRLGHYYFTRILQKTIGEDSGASIRNSIKAGAKYGSLPEALWPYNTNKFRDRPANDLFKTAATHKVTSYHRIKDGDLATLKATLATGYLVGFGFLVYSSMMSKKVQKSGMIPMPSSKDKEEGGHAIVAVGYDDKLQAVKLKNSWGPKCGQAGYFWMPYAYISDKDLANDFWIVRSTLEYKS